MAADGPAAALVVDAITVGKTVQGHVEYVALTDNTSLFF